MDGRAFLSVLRRRLLGDPLQYALSLSGIMDIDSRQSAELEAIAFGADEEEDRLLAIRVLLARGGEEATRFLKRYLTSEFRSPLEKMTVARSIGLDDGALPKLLPLSTDIELLTRARGQVDSADPWERVLGAGLLGLTNGEEDRISLTHLAESDVDTRVRAAAVRALGAIGNEATLGYLRQYFDLSPYPPAEGDIEFMEALRAAIGTLEGRFKTSRH